MSPPCTLIGVFFFQPQTHYELMSSPLAVQFCLFVKLLVKLCPHIWKIFFFFKAKPFYFHSRLTIRICQFHLSLHRSLSLSLSRCKEQADAKSATISHQVVRESTQPGVLFIFCKANQKCDFEFTVQPNRDMHVIAFSYNLNLLSLSLSLSLHSQFQIRMQAHN